MPRFVLFHEHRPHECRTAYAAWNGFTSPLRRRPAQASCASGGHRIYWTVEAADADEALAQLPCFLAVRTEVTEVSEVPIP
jgi:hypothetical protein